jgi:hypothetical protein
MLGQSDITIDLKIDTVYQPIIEGENFSLAEFSPISD